MQMITLNRQWPPVDNGPGGQWPPVDNGLQVNHGTQVDNGHHVNHVHAMFGLAACEVLD